jgi:hypothetical protein
MRRLLPSPALLILLLMLLVGCGQSSTPPPPTNLPSSTDQPTVLPSPTTLHPAATMAIPPTITPRPTATGVSVVEATAPAEATPVVLLTAADFGDNRNPLTGELVEDPAVLDRRPLVIKISNAPALYVRPQSGLNEADLAFEHLAEGFTTRFTLVVYGQTPPSVGPIRSARLIDLELPAMYDAALIYSGTSVGVGQRLNRSDFWNRVLRSNEPGYYRTGANKPFEHTLYGTPETFWDVLEGRGENQRPVFTSNMAFHEIAPSGGQATDSVTVSYRSTVVDWRYDSETNRYFRWSDDAPHLDANDGQQVSAANVLMIYAYHVEDASICEQISNGQCVALTIEIQVWGSGPAIILRDGQRYEATWRRENRSDMFTFYDQGGNPFPLQIGNSWFQIVTNWVRDPVSYTP